MIETVARFRLDDRTALVTGAGSGIGRATAHALAGAGATVIVTDRDGDAAQVVASEIGRDGHFAVSREMDVADEAQVESTVRHVLDEIGSINVLVNNAGMGARMRAEDMPTETWEEVVRVNLTGTFLCSREVGRFMLASGGGSIVNVASIMGLSGGGLYPNPAYQATKGAIVNLTRALALDWAAEGIRVNAVAPTFARTPLTEKLLADPDMEQAIMDNTPMGRLVEPEEVAAAVLFLASDAAAMITGHTLPVDGGWLAR